MTNIPIAREVDGHSLGHNNIQVHNYMYGDIDKIEKKHLYATGLRSALTRKAGGRGDAFLRICVTLNSLPCF